MKVIGKYGPGTVKRDLGCGYTVELLMFIWMSALAMVDEVSWESACESVLLSFFWAPDTFEKLMKALLLPLKVFAFKSKEFIDLLKSIQNSCKIDK